MGEVESPVVLNSAIVSAWSEPADLRIFLQRTGLKLERVIDRAVDDAGLEAAICIAKGDCRRHCAKVVVHISNGCCA